MKTPKVSIIVWNRKRRTATGKLVRQKRYAVSFRCPDTGTKRRVSFATKVEAEAYRDHLLAEIAGERYYNPNMDPTIAEVVDHWRQNKAGQVKAQTMRGYAPLLKIIVGPLLQGTPRQRAHHQLTGEKPHRDSKLLLMLGDETVSGLQTAQLRKWHNLVREEVGAHTANRVMSMLKGILALAEEDFGVRVCSMPTNLARRKAKPKKEILTPDEVAELIAHAKADKARGIFVAFPFLTGVRVSEQLGLLWQWCKVREVGVATQVQQPLADLRRVKHRWFLRLHWQKIAESSQKFVNRRGKRRFNCGTRQQYRFAGLTQHDTVPTSNSTSPPVSNHVGSPHVVSP